MKHKMRPIKLSLIIAVALVLVAVSALVILKYRNDHPKIPECVAGGAGGIANEPCYSPPGSIYL